VDASGGFHARGIVFFRALEHRAVEERMELPGFRSLCEIAMRTKLDIFTRWGRTERLASLSLSDSTQREREHYTLFLGGTNVMPELNPADYAPETFEPMQVRVSVAKPDAFDKSKGRNFDPYYVAEVYGAVMMPTAHPTHYIIYVKRREIPRIAADPRFKIEEIQPEFPSEKADTLPVAAAPLPFAAEAVEPGDELPSHSPEKASCPKKH
jgi:hypothetical protein